MKPFDSEPTQLSGYEAVMEKWRTPFVAVGLALGAICTGRLYREEHTTFEAYCRERWGCSPHYAHRLIRAAELLARMTIAPGQPRPEHESQVRPLVGLRPDQAQIAWEHAVRMAGKGKITGPIVKLSVKELGSEAEKAKPAQDPRPNRTQQRRVITAAFGELLTLLRQKAAHPPCSKRPKPCTPKSKPSSQCSSRSDEEHWH